MRWVFYGWGVGLAVFMAAWILSPQHGMKIMFALLALGVPLSLLTFGAVVAWKVAGKVWRWLERP